MNYFNYFTEIEDTFVRRRGKHLLLSSMDWALIESWKECGIPLHIALRGIETAFDSHAAKQRKRSVKTLLYCQEEVEAQYAEWLESRVGAHEEGIAEVGGGIAATDDKSPFSREAVLAYLRKSRESLDSLYRESAEANEDELCEALERAARLLCELESDYATTLQPDARKLEDSLSGIERMLNDTLCEITPAERLDEIRKDTNRQLRPYRAHMEPAVYKQTLDNLVLKRLREDFRVPRLSLFYL